MGHEQIRWGFTVPPARIQSIPLRSGRMPASARRHPCPTTPGTRGKVRVVQNPHPPLTLAASPVYDNRRGRQPPRRRGACDAARGIRLNISDFRNVAQANDARVYLDTRTDELKVRRQTFLNRAVDWIRGRISPNPWRRPNPMRRTTVSSARSRTTPATSAATSAGPRRCSRPMSSRAERCRRAGCAK